MKINVQDLLKFQWPYRTYQVWIINTATECNLYLWDNWRLLLPALDSLIKLTQEPAFIRTFQAYKYENKWLGFGRMKWNEESNIKWTTKYRKNTSPANQPEFYGTEIWAPDWNRVCKTGMPPDVFFCLYNHERSKKTREGLIIALPGTLYKKNKQTIDVLLQKLSSHIADSKIYETRRDWWGRTASRNNIEHMTAQEIEKIIGYK